MSKIFETSVDVAGLAFLIESGMERAELVMASKSITDKLQDMAETLAKIEASDVMPMMDSMKENFGPEVAQRFEEVVTQKLRDMTEALRSAKDAIGNEILRMEASVNGEPASDLDMADTLPPAEEETLEEPAQDDTMGTEQAPAGDIADAGGEQDTGSTTPEGGDIADVPSDEELEDLFADENVPAAGRIRKESVERVGTTALRESADPDRLVMRAFARVIREGRDAPTAVTAVAKFFSIDASDVIGIVRDFKA